MERCARSSLIVAFLMTTFLVSSFSIAHAQTPNTSNTRQQTSTVLAAYEASKDLLEQGCNNVLVTLHGNTGLPYYSIL